MPIDSIIRQSFDRSFGLYRDFVHAIDDGVLASRLAQLPSNTVGQQLWCVVGARESFSRAIKANQWSGFSRSLKETTSKDRVADALVASEHAVAEVLSSIATYTDVQNRLIVDLLEHEAAHHSQLIRYHYGLKLAIPESWKSKYALD